MKRAMIVTLTVLAVWAGSSWAQQGGADDKANAKTKTYDKASPELMRQGGQPKGPGQPAGIAVSDEGVPGSKPQQKKTPKSK